MSYIKKFISMRKLNKILDMECDYYLYKIDSFDDRFNKSFFKQLIIYAKEDIFELFTQFAIKTFDIDKNGVFMTQSGLRKMIMCCCFYNTLCFSNRQDYDKVGMSENLFAIFGVNETEKEKYCYFTDIINTYNTGFELEFTSYILETVFGLKGNAPIFLAFIGNFFYNSYQGFIDSLTNYAPPADCSLLV